MYFMFWAGLHSFLASRKAKDLAKTHFGPNSRRWYRFAFVIGALLTLVPLLALLVLLPDRLIYAVPSPWRWIMKAGQVLSLGFLIWSIAAAQPTVFIGISQLRGKSHIAKSRLTRSGLYGLVRHPMYLFSLIIMWLSPVMTVNRLTLYVLIALYFFIGSYHEEILLEAEFGKDYSDYRRRVPRLIPFLNFHKHP